MVVGVEALRGIELLVVDDEPGILRALTLLLSSLQVRVTALSSPGEALAYLERGGRPDAIVSNLRMPGMNGIEFLQHLRVHTYTTPFVLMSGHATTEEVNQAKLAGSSAFLGKPFPPQDLLRVLTELCPKVRGVANGA